MKPITVKEGSAVVKIYHTPVVSKGRKYPAYTVRYYADGKPQQKKFGALEGKDGARQHAEDAARRINDGSIRTLLMTERQRMEYFDAIDALKGVPLAKAVSFYLSRSPEAFSAKTTRKVYDELLVAKKQDGLSESWLRDLRLRLLRFVERFPEPLPELSGAEVDAWLRGLNLSVRSRNNFRCAISTLVSFAKAKRYLPKSFDELDNIAVLKSPRESIAIFTPVEMRLMLGRATNQELPFLVLGGFAGIRTAEITRLKWENIGKEFIEVSADKAKTAQRRLVPLLEVAASWLKRVRKPSGRVWPYSVPFLRQNIIDRLCGEELEWKQNALRHSFISYRLAVLQNTGKVALECGTSEKKIFSNYRELITPEQAEEWFSLFPKITNPLQTRARKRKKQ